MTLVTEAMKMTGPTILSRIHLRRQGPRKEFRRRVPVGKTRFRLEGWLVLGS